MARKLRIGASVFFGVLAVALCVLWVRSYSHRDQFNVRYWPTGAVEIASMRGWLELWLGNCTIDWEDRINTNTLRDWAIERQRNQRGLSRGNTVGRPLHVASPHLAALAIALVIAVLPWLKRTPLHFSLRTLLITTTLVAAVLGLAVWAMR